MKVLTSIDMSSNEVQNVILHPSTNAPANPKVGMLYTDISGEEAVIKWWNGKEWIELGGGPRIPENVPTVKNPSVSLTIAGNSESLAEVGSVIPLAYEAVFNPGQYSYGPETGIVAEQWKVYDEDEVFTEPTGSFADVTVGQGAEFTINVEVNHTAGAIPVGDQGNPYPDMQIPAGKVSYQYVGSVEGYRKYFYGATTSLEAMSSEIIRSLTNSEEPIKSGTTFDLSIAKGSNQVVIAFPTDAGLELSSVIDTGAFGIDVYDIFNKQVVKVEGANGYEAIDYDVYVYTPDVSLNKNLYKVTIS